MKKLEVIDFFRGFAIFTIALMHLIKYSLPGPLQAAAAFGGAGVHVFILCSGFGLYLSQLNRSISYAQFLKKRFSKVYWPYAIAVVLYALWQWFAGGFVCFKAKELASHLFLYKMFDNSLDISICYPFWFISTILQFYLFWPIIVRLMNHGHGLLVALFISVIWWIVVGILGYEDYRPWGSFFLQYLWEFALGMQLAKWYKDGRFSEEDFFTKVDLRHLIVAAVVGMALTGIMGKIGGTLKLFNDIPSLVGYTSLLLILYKLNIWKINNLFSWSNKISYELYLVHSLVYVMIRYILSDCLPSVIEIVICLVMAYLCAYAYNRFLKMVHFK